MISFLCKCIQTYVMTSVVQSHLSALAYVCCVRCTFIFYPLVMCHITGCHAEVTHLTLFICVVVKFTAVKRSRRRQLRQHSCVSVTSVAFVRLPFRNSVTPLDEAAMRFPQLPSFPRERAGSRCSNSFSPSPPLCWETWLCWRVLPCPFLQLESDGAALSSW